MDSFSRPPTTKYASIPLRVQPCAALRTESNTISSDRSKRTFSAVLNAARSHDSFVNSCAESLKKI